MAGELRLVKYLYVDDEGNLVAETWSGVVAIGVPKRCVGRPYGVAGLNSKGHIDLPQMTPFLEEYDHLPPPGEDYVGKPLRLKLPGAGTKTEIYACLVNSQDRYEWVKLSEST